ncbi:MAG: hypothetical protein K6F82_05165 [Sphaerochaetaceae bacterium]|nr:hypothetical protein [Sphaerochaetaceae bacterium]
MSRKYEKEEQIDKDFYKLNKKAVEDLVTADKENSPEVSREELKQYRKHSSLNIPNWLKVVFIKFWFAGAGCYFFLWGLGIYVPSGLDLMAITALAMGFVTDILVNNILRFMEETPGANDKWMMVTVRGFVSLILNVIYSFVIMFCVYATYNGINRLIIGMTGKTDTLPFAVEPVAFGLIYMGVDMLFVGLKRLVVKNLAGARKKEEKS